MVYLLFLVVNYVFHLIVYNVHIHQLHVQHAILPLEFPQSILHQYVNPVKYKIVYNVQLLLHLHVQNVIKHMGYLQLILTHVKNVKYLIVNNALNLQLNVYDALMGIQ